jgi:dihydropyrimidinase
MSKLLIRGGTLITASETTQADLLMDEERIAAVGRELPAEGAEVIDAGGMLVMPGGVDPHTHFDLPMFDTVSSDDHYSGHKAAAFGGTTTVMDFVPQPARGSLRAGVEAWHAKADGKAAIDFAFHANVTRLDAEVLAEIPLLLEEGISTLKVFMAYNGRLRLQDGEIFQVLRAAAEHGMLTMLHAEDGDVIELLVRQALEAGDTAPEWHARTRPAWGAIEAALRGFALASQAGAPLYLVHMNTAGEVDMLRYARSQGLPVMGETCPQYLFFSAELLRRQDGAKWVCSPPLRTVADQAGLWAGLADGTVQTIGTDHCAFFTDGSRPIEYEGAPVAIPGKELGAADFTKIPNGLPGVGDRLPVLWSYGVGQKRMSPNQFVALTSTNPARIFGLYPRKGSLLPGADADLVIWNPGRKLRYGRAHAHHRTDTNLYEGWEMIGFPSKVFLRGNLIVDDERWLGRKGMGRFVRRDPGAPVL